MMIKIFFTFLFFFLSFSFGFYIDLKTSLYLDENEGIVNLPDIELKFSRSVSGFTLYIPEKFYFIFHPYYSGAKFSDDARSIYFSGYYSGNVLIKGLKIRTYDQEIWDGKICLKVDNKDICSKKSIYLEENGRYKDNMKPLPIKNLKYFLSGNNVYLKWIPSPDLDIYYQVLRVYRGGYFLKDIHLPSKISGYNLYDMNPGYYKIEIYAKDKYYMSYPAVVKFVIKKINETNKRFQSGTGRNVKNINVKNIIHEFQNKVFTTGYVIDINSLSCKEKIINSGDVLCDEKVFAKKFNFKNLLFANFQRKFDIKLRRFFRKKGKTNFVNIIKLRNDLLDKLYLYDRGKIKGKKLINEILPLIKQLKSLISY